jgi:hypothetical protein
MEPEALASWRFTYGPGPWASMNLINYNPLQNCDCEAPCGKNIFYHQQGKTKKS